MLDGVHHGIHFCLVYVVAAYGQGDCAGGHGVHDGAEATLLAVHDQIFMRFRDDGKASVVVYYLDEYSHAPAFKKAVVCKFLF